MRQKLGTPSGVRNDAPCPADTGNRRRWGVAGRGRTNARRRPGSTGAPNAQGRKSGLAPLIRRGPPTPIEAGAVVVDDFPTAIPVTARELEVIETYLAALLDDALGKRE
jgi:hypothetical protein